MVDSAHSSTSTAAASRQRLPAAAQEVLRIAERLQAFERLERKKQGSVLVTRLNRLLIHAKRTAPFWSERLRAWSPAEHATDATLNALPTLSRTDLQLRFDELRADFPNRKAMRISVTSSSGSTGTPVRVEHLATRNTTAQFATRLLECRWQGIDTSKPLGRLSATVTDDDHHQLGIPFSWFGPTAVGFRRCLKGREYSELYDYCASKNPSYLVSGPPMFNGLARYAIQSGRRDLRPEMVLTYGSVVNEETRQIVREGLGAKIVDRYSSEETGTIAAQCPKHDHLHVLSPMALVEIVDDEGAPCAVGQPGRVLVTNMQSFAMPLIRYEIGDIAEWGAPCDCGITLPVIAKLWGRENHRITHPDGRTTYVKIFHRDFDGLPDLEEYRFVLHGNAALVAQLKVKKPSPELASAVTERLQRLLGFAYPVTVLFVDKIDWGSSWKKENFAVSDLPPPAIPPTDAGFD